MDELLPETACTAGRGTGHGSCLYHRRGRLHSAQDGLYMLVGREGRIFGTIGGGNLEYQAVLHAQELVQEKKSEYREYDLGTGEGRGLAWSAAAE